MLAPIQPIDRPRRQVICTSLPQLQRQLVLAGGPVGRKVRPRPRRRCRPLPVEHRVDFRQAPWDVVMAWIRGSLGRSQAEVVGMIIGGILLRQILNVVVGVLALEAQLLQRPTDWSTELGPLLELPSQPWW